MNARSPLPSLRVRPLPYGECAAQRNKTAWRMSQLGQKQTSEDVQARSALPPKADIVQQPNQLRHLQAPEYLAVLVV
jgi:hypothetical protein